MSVQVALSRPRGAQIDRKRPVYVPAIACRNKCFSEGIRDDAILVRPKKQR
jgi:hypothetical protein